MRALLSILIFGFSFGLWAQNETHFEKANALYNKGQYAEAIEKYETILDNDQHSAEVYYNLANAHYKLNNIAPSIFYYEKALQLKPNDPDIKNNRAFAQKMTVDGFVETPQVGFSKIINNTINLLSFDNWAILAVASVILFVILYLSYYFSYNTNKKRLAFVLSLLSVIVALIAVSMAFQRYSLDKKDQPAIVFAQESKIKADPNTSSDEIIRVHEGTKVQVLEAFNDWKKVKVSNGSEGWIPSEDIKLLNSF
ncbi:tetratricopeptide repeat protein [Winogradskyella sp. A3E31]|uniref:tetratricopeptide repeat protein n=1 Tax=Winogradskyella sp. A3E31 TaxID=3349637 RepID=UPI00398AF6B2